MIAILSIFLACIASAAARVSPLLLVPEPRDGLLADPDEFAAMDITPRVATPPLGYAEHLKIVQEHYLVLEGKHPPVYYFFCTVYYLPRESGFTAARGFDMQPSTRVPGHTLPKSFANAVKMEGTGKLATPTPAGKTYITYQGEYRQRSLGNRNNTLYPRKSAAVHLRNPLFRHGTPLRVLDPAIYRNFGATDFSTGDTGGGLFRSQIDLYWGEDDPLSPLETYRPASCDIAIRWMVPVIISEPK
jgi:hypothetical protein